MTQILHQTDLDFERCQVGLLECLDPVAIPADYRVERTGQWIFFNRTDSGSEKIRQGWKLHISMRFCTIVQTIEAALPVLFQERCNFKIVADTALLRAFNDGMYGIAAVGKGITVYPPQSRVREIAHRLADVLTGFEGPRINSDRRVQGNAPVYYRFGPFSPELRIDEHGQVDVCLKSPTGDIASGRAGASYSAPEWTEDPWGPDAICGARLPRSDGALMIGDYYRITSAIVRNYRGCTYRAVDTRTDQRVIIKQVNAFVNESAAGDARAYLHNELRVLRGLVGVDRVPRVVDHFSYGGDEYLVTTELGTSNLKNDILDKGVFSCDSRKRRNVLHLGKGLLSVIDAVHRRGIVMRDLAPRNVVPMADNQWGVIDFELSRMDDVQLFGWTPGYSAKEQRNNCPGTVADDYFSLGSTLIYALTGIDPVAIDENEAVNIERTMTSLAAVCGHDAPVLKIIAGLLSDDHLERCNAAARLRTVEHLAPSARTKAGARQPELDTILRNVLATVAAAATSILMSRADRRVLPPSLVAQVGTAGLIAELALHPMCLEQASALSMFSAEIADTITMPVGLLYGRMGLALAISAVAKATGEPALYLAAERTLPGPADLAGEKRCDVANGIAGLGIGYLAFAASARNPSLAMSLANDCADRILRGQAEIEEQLRMLPDGNPGHAISIADGFAHGRAGIACFMLAHAVRTGDGASEERARTMLDALADLAPILASRAKSRMARPMAASWCQGLAGIGTALSRAAHVFGDERYLTAARRCASGCLAIAPRVPLATQCCGLAGIGDFLLDISIVSKNESFRSRAIDILSLMLARSGGSETAPRFPCSDLSDEVPGWGTGITGVLSFLRRLAKPSTPRLWLCDEVLLHNSSSAVGERRQVN